MGGFIPLSDASRRPTNFPVATVAIILANFIVFFFELAWGDAWVLKWCLVPAQISSGHDWVTILTAMFLHGSWSHILGNMVFLWAFGPEIEDAMNPLRYIVFYLLGGLAAMLGQIALAPHSTVPNLGASGAIAAVMGAFLVTYPHDRIKSLLIIFVFVQVRFIPAALIIVFWFLTQLVNVGVVATGASSENGGVAYAAHLAGCVFGALVARFFEDPERMGEAA